MSPTQLTTSETLNLAADLIEERGWAQGNDGMTLTGPLCLEGGIAAAMGVGAGHFTHKGEPLFNYGEVHHCPAYTAVRSYLQQTEREEVWQWNDRAGRTAEEVIATLRAAALVEQTREAALADDMIALLSAEVASS